ncbi:hypothetical protein VTP01DRAFT_328 [Rhizomucor pusillus]|uniref:uncharacterized protein n=1 Tax=Rhizomucor pusillus TaxID=4840 RepID=UPI003742C2A0
MPEANEDYKTKFDTEDKYLKFFNENCLRDWSYEKFASAFAKPERSSASTRIAKTRTLRAAYKSSPSTILASTSVPSKVKQYVASKARKDESNKESNDSKPHIEAGPESQVLVNYGNIVAHSNVMEQSSSLDSRKDSQEEVVNEIQRKRPRSDDEIADFFNPTSNNVTNDEDRTLNKDEMSDDQEVSKD